MTSASNNACFINTLPTELLVHIFIVGSDDTLDRVEGRPVARVKKVDADARTEHTTAHIPKKVANEDIVDIDGEDNVDDDEWDDDDDFDEDDETPFPVLVSHVCHRWREVVLGIPILWVKLRFSESFNRDQARECLKRAKDAPLDINIDLTEEEEAITARMVGETFGSDSLEIMREIMDILVPHVHHWGQLFAEATMFDDIHHMLTRISSDECAQTGAPLLQLIHIGYCDDSEVSSYEEETFNASQFRQGLQPFGGKLPSLKEISLWAVHIDWSIFVSPSVEDGSLLDQSSIKNLVALELRYHMSDVRPSIEQFRACLLASPNIESLTLYASCPHPLPAPSDTQWYAERIPLYGLVTLTLGSLPPNSLIALFKTIFIPALQKLTIEFDGEDHSDVMAHLATVSESYPDDAILNVPDVTSAHLVTKGRWSIASKITSLKLGALACSDDALQQFYSQLKLVDTLDLNMNYLPEIAGTLLFRMDSLNPKAFFCPKLRKLLVSGVSGEDVCKLVKVRLQGGNPLEEVFLDVTTQMDAQDMEFLSNNVLKVDFVEYSDEEEDDSSENSDEEDSDEDSSESSEEE